MKLELRADPALRLFAMRGEFMLRRTGSGQGVLLGFALLLGQACASSELPPSTQDAQVDDGQHDGGGAADAGSERDAGPSHSDADASTARVDAGTDAGEPPPPPLPPLVVGYTGSGASRGGNAGAKLNIGHQFEVMDEGIVFRELGVWDEGANGLHAAHTVTLFALSHRFA